MNVTMTAVSSRRMMIFATQSQSTGCCAFRCHIHDASYLAAVNSNSSRTVRFLSMDIFKKSTPKQHPQQQRQPPWSKNATPLKDDRSKIASSNKLHEALQQSLLSSTSSSGISSKIQRPTMTTTQIAMSKYGNELNHNTTNATTKVTTATGATNGSSSSSSMYISIQDRKRKNQQAITNVIFGFGIVLLACQSFKSGIEKRRIKQQYNYTKETLEQTQSKLQQLIYNNSNNKDNNNQNPSGVSPEIQAIANRIVQQEFHSTSNSNETQLPRQRRSNGWFTKRPKSTSSSIYDTSHDDNLSELLGTNNIFNNDTTTQTASDDRTNNNGSNNDDGETVNNTNTTTDREKRVAVIIQQQLQSLLHDVAFDDNQKEALHVQALAAAGATTATTKSVSGAATNGANTVDLGLDDNNIASSIEQLLFESLQEGKHELTNTKTAPIITTSIDTRNTTTTRVENNNTTTTTTTTSDGNNKVVRKRLFSI